MIPNDIDRTLEQALKDRNPEAYKRLRESGELEQTLESLIVAMSETVEVLQSQIMDRLVRQNSPHFEPEPLARQQKMTMQFLEADRTAIEQAIETIDAL